MWALHQARPAAARGLLDGTPALLLVVLAGSAALVALLTVNGWLPSVALPIVGIACAHGGLVATALAWASSAGEPGEQYGRALVLPVVLLAGASAASVAYPVGALLYFATPLSVWSLGRHGQLRALGIGGPIAGLPIIAGAAIGAFLGGHLLISATRTLGHRVQLDTFDGVLRSFGYDAGANVLAAECFFRGALFNRAQRRWSFAVGVLVSTGAYLGRYLVDPLLPRVPEMIVGAVFYLALLSVSNCWLFRWSGSLLPGFLSGLLFFTAYRMLALG